MKWGERHQHLPLSMGRVACSSFYVGKWAGSPDQAWEHAVGKEFAWAFLLALWPEQYASKEWAGREEHHDFREIFEKDLSEATTTAEKDKLTLGMYSKVDKGGAFRDQLDMYASSAFEKAVIGDDGDQENPSSGTSSFPQIWEFPLLYEWACHLICFVPIHQQLVESLFSMYDKRTQMSDQREIDIVRIGQYHGAESRPIGRVAATSKEIHESGNLAIGSARASKKTTQTTTPHARRQRKRDHHVPSYLAKVRANMAGTCWSYASDAEDEVGAEGSGASDDA